MPPPSNEDDLKRRARRRLIGAVALTLLAVVVLPLLLEEEPPPASSLAVRMAIVPTPVPEQLTGQDQPDEPIVAVAPMPSVPPSDAQEPPPRPQHEASEASPAKPTPRPEPKPQAVKPTPPPVSTGRPAATSTSPSRPAASSEMFVVQLAALSDAGRARALQTRAAKTGLPAYTDKVGTLTRVRVGPFATREDAMAAVVRLAESGIAGQVLSQ